MNPLLKQHYMKDDRLTKRIFDTMVQVSTNLTNVKGLGKMNYKLPVGEPTTPQQLLLLVEALEESTSMLLESSKGASGVIKRIKKEEAKQDFKKSL